MCAGLPHPSLFPITNIKFTALTADAPKCPVTEITLSQDSVVPLAQWLQYGKHRIEFLDRPETEDIQILSQAVELAMPNCGSGAVTLQSASINQPIQTLRFCATVETQMHGAKWSTYFSSKRTTFFARISPIHPLKLYGFLLVITQLQSHSMIKV